MSAISGFVVLAVLAAIYLVPAIVAHRRGHTSSTGILVANLVFGWTVLGWLLCLVWAFSGANRRAVVEA